MFDNGYGRDITASWRRIFHGYYHPNATVNLLGNGTETKSNAITCEWLIGMDSQLSVSVDISLHTKLIDQ